VLGSSCRARTRGEREATHLEGDDGAHRIDLSGQTGDGDTGVTVADESTSDDGRTKAPK